MTLILRWIISAAAVWRMRECLDGEGFHKVKIVVSSGFGPAKCRLMAEAKAPIDVIGTSADSPAWAAVFRRRAQRCRQGRIGSTWM